MLVEQVAPELENEALEEAASEREVAPAAGSRQRPLHIVHLLRVRNKLEWGRINSNSPGKVARRRAALPRCRENPAQFKAFHDLILF